MHTHLQNTLEALIRLADARYRAVLACTAGRSGMPCADTGEIATAAPAGCARMVPTGASEAGAKRGTLLLAPTVTTSITTTTVTANMCSDSCVLELEAFLGNAGCCAATAAAAQAEWFAAISGNLVLGTHFRVQWSIDNHLEEFRKPDSCPAAASKGIAASGIGSLPTATSNTEEVRAVNTECGVTACGLVWPSACCFELSCENNGSKEFPGACFCACLTGWVGNNCGEHDAHVRLSIAIVGLSKLAFETRLQGLVLNSIATAAGSGVSAVELDTVAEVQLATTSPTAAASSRIQVGSSGSKSISWSVNSGSSTVRMVAAGEASVELHLDVRIRVNDGADAAFRAATRVKQAINDGLLGAALASVGAGSRARTLRLPVAYDTVGREVCDNVFLPCNFAVPTNSSSNSGGLQEYPSTSGSGVMVLAVSLGVVVTFCIIAAASVLECRRRNKYCFYVPPTEDSENNKNDDSKLQSKLRRRPQPRHAFFSKSATQAPSRPKVVSSSLVFITEPGQGNDKEFYKSHEFSTDVLDHYSYHEMNHEHEPDVDSPRAGQYIRNLKTGRPVISTELVHPFWQASPLDHDFFALTKTKESPQMKSQWLTPLLPTLQSHAPGPAVLSTTARPAVLKGFAAAAAAAAAAAKEAETQFYSIPSTITQANLCSSYPAQGEYLITHF
jgi:hypothetical protein